MDCSFLSAPLSHCSICLSLRPRRLLFLSSSFQFVSPLSLSLWFSMSLCFVSVHTVIKANLLAFSPDLLPPVSSLCSCFPSKVALIFRGFPNCCPNWMTDKIRLLNLKLYMCHIKAVHGCFAPSMRKLLFWMNEISLFFFLHFCLRYSVRVGKERETSNLIWWQS